MLRNKSGIKRDRQGKIRKERNKILKSRVRTAYNKVVEALDAKDNAALQDCINFYYSSVDKAVKKNLYHTNKGARKKAGIYKIIKAASLAGQATPVTNG